MQKLKPKHVVVATLALIAEAGCTRVSPDRVTSDRMDYGEVIANSWKRQTLLNVVRLRYADAPVFLDVASVINSYSISGSVNANATLPAGGASSVYGLGASGNWSNTPTVTYQPVLGESFTKSMLQPIPPSAVFQLIQGGWPASLVMKTVVRSVNGLRNDSSGVGADQGYRELVDAMSRIQLGGGLGIRVEAREGGAAVVVVLRNEGVSEQTRQDRRRVHALLGIEERADEFEVVYGVSPRSTKEVAVLSRSMLELLLELGWGIDLPAGHEKEGRTNPGRRRAGDAQATPLIQIRSGTAPPSESYAAVPYKGNWYWIDDCDIGSKRTFTFLMILFSLAETGRTSASPVVTIPSR